MKLRLMLLMLTLISCGTTGRDSGVSESALLADDLSTRAVARVYAERECETALGVSDDVPVCVWQTSGSLIRGLELTGFEHVDPSSVALAECLLADRPLLEQRCLALLREATPIQTLDSYEYPDGWVPEGCTATGVCADTSWDASGGFGGGPGAGGSVCQTCEGWTSSCGIPQPFRCYAFDYVLCMAVSFMQGRTNPDCLFLVTGISCSTPEDFVPCIPENGIDYDCDPGRRGPACVEKYRGRLKGCHTRSGTAQWDPPDRPTDWVRVRQCPIGGSI